MPSSATAAGQMQINARPLKKSPKKVVQKSCPYLVASAGELSQLSAMCPPSKLITKGAGGSRAARPIVSCVVLSSKVKRGRRGLSHP